jgi:hypothetical protein
MKIVRLQQQKRENIETVKMIKMEQAAATEQGPQ